MEETKTFFVAGFEHLRQLSFKVAAGAGPSAVIVKAPHSSIRQYSPSDAVVRHDLGRREVSEDLAMGSASLGLTVLVAGIQCTTEPLALLHRQSVPEAIVGLFLGSSPHHRFAVREQ